MAEGASVKIFPLPTVTVSPASQTVYVGQAITLTATPVSVGSGSDTYEWYNITSGSPIDTHKSGLTFTEPANALGTFSYDVAVTDSNVGKGTSNVALVTVDRVVGCTDSNKGGIITITGSSIKQTVQITNQSAVYVTGSSDNVTINMPGNNCNITVQSTGSSNKLNIYNGTIKLSETGSSDVATLHNTVVSMQTITGSSDKVNGAILDGKTFTITGSSNLVESVQIESLNALQITGSSANVTMTMLAGAPTMAITVTGSSNIMHTINGAISIAITGSSNLLYYHDTTITSQSITGTGNKLIAD